MGAWVLHAVLKHTRAAAVKRYLATRGARSTVKYGILCEGGHMFRSNSCTQKKTVFNVRSRIPRDARRRSVQRFPPRMISYENRLPR